MTSILCSGSIALDTTRTPFKTVENERKISTSEENSEQKHQRRNNHRTH